MSSAATALSVDDTVLDAIGRLTGHMPGNTLRGRRPLNKAAMTSFTGEAIRNRILPQLKAAEAGPSAHQQFSESFAAMAFTFIDERSPTLRE